MQVYPFTIRSLFQFFCEDFLDSLFKMEKREKREQELQRLYSKKLFKKNEHFENILLLNVLPIHHQSAPDHALPLV